jgi:transcriptional regulator with XRE-family HTH domain
MSIDKLYLTDDIKSFIMYERKKLKLTAEETSEKIGRSKSWLAQIENGRLSSIKKSDFIKLVSLFLDISSDEAIIYISNKFNQQVEIDVSNTKSKLPIINMGLIQNFLKEQYPNATEINIQINETGMIINTK